MNIGVTNFAEQIIKPELFARVLELAGGKPLWQRIPFYWPQVVNPDGTVHVGWHFEAVKLCWEAKLPVLGLLDGSPHGEGIPPHSIFDWLHYVTQTVTHFPSVRHWQIWNEPDHPSFWKPKPSAMAYGAFLAATYYRIKDVDPTLTVLAGPASGNWIDWYGKLYEAGGRWWFDAPSIHTYRMTSLKMRSKVTDEYKKVLALMAEHGDDHKSPWLTEFGSNAIEKGEKFQADQLTGSFGRMREQWPGLAGAFVFLMHDPAPGNPNVGYGLTDASGKPRAAFEAMKAVIQNAV